MGLINICSTEFMRFVKSFSFLSRDHVLVVISQEMVLCVSCPSTKSGRRKDKEEIW